MKTWCGSESGPGFKRHYLAILGWIRYLFGKISEKVF